MQEEDAAVRSTNDDATTSRASAVALGYLNDPFVKLFVKRPAKRPPIINRGTYIRTKTIDSICNQILAIGSCQFVVLGAGSDTRFFNLTSERRQPVKYFEIDFPEVTARKAMTIRKNKQLAELIGEHTLAAGGCEIHGDGYCLLSGDLRNWITEIVPKLESNGFRKDLPTLYISECVVVYLDSDSINSLLTWCSSATISSFFVTYEQIEPNDAFGRTMIENLKMRNITLPGLESCPSLASHNNRFLETGWKGPVAYTMREVYDRHLSAEEQARIAKLEIFDEVEEWRLMGDHYCVSFAWNVTPALANESTNIEVLRGRFSSISI